MTYPRTEFEVRDPDFRKSGEVVKEVVMRTYLDERSSSSNVWRVTLPELGGLLRTLKQFYGEAE